MSMALGVVLGMAVTKQPPYPTELEDKIRLKNTFGY